MPRFRISLNELQEGLLLVVRRFPLAVLFCLLALFAFMQLIEGEQYFARMLMISGLALPLIVAVGLFSESYQWKETLKYVLQLALLVLLGVYYFFLPEDFGKAPLIHIYRYVGIAFAAHLLVAISVVGSHNRQLLFWYFNQYLFFRWLQASLYSFVLYAGIAGAIAAVHFLFNIDVSDKLYGHLFALISCLFHPLYFLAGVPRMPFKNEEVLPEYPKQLNIFSIYILLPIVLIYLLILYAYGIKIVVTRSWPIGWVGWLVLGFSVSGIFAWLLVYPLQQTDKQNLAKLYFKYYFFALIPVLFLLYMAIYKRLDMYGFTEDRYIVFILAIWLTIVAIYSIFKKGNIIFIPLSLLLVTLVSIIGPLSMFSVSERAQWKRMIEILEKNHVLNTDNKIQSADTTLQIRMSINDRFELTSIAGYLCEMHGIQSFEKLFVVNIDSAKLKQTWWQKDFVLRQIGIEPQYSKEENTDFAANNYYGFSCKSEPINIAGYNYSIKLTLNQGFDEQAHSLSLSQKNNDLILNLNEIKDTIPIKNWIRSKMKDNYDSTFTPEEMTIHIKDTKHDLKLIILSISGTLDSDKVNIYNAETLVLYNNP